MKLKTILMVECLVKKIELIMYNANYNPKNITQNKIDDIKNDISMLYYNESYTMFYVHLGIIQKCGLYDYFCNDLTRYMDLKLVKSKITCRFHYIIIKSYNNKLLKMLDKL